MKLNKMRSAVFALIIGIFASLACAQPAEYLSTVTPTVTATASPTITPSPTFTPTPEPQVERIRDFMETVRGAACEGVIPEPLPRGFIEMRRCWIDDKYISYESYETQIDLDNTIFLSPDGQWTKGTLGGDYYKIDDKEGGAVGFTFNDRPFLIFVMSDTVSANELYAWTLENVIKLKKGPTT